ncbi:hypothetical protein IV203_032583 [Nitzschia inconspicua]|uniref:Uncharacterized protein n=1 Tax=Nitzschia inconspicua TaxID=303405 RepID=A0A9K3KJY5_9STRA|nr:hypothetical protein IV203_032583 [Nitzschia inconspicua]
MSRKSRSCRGKATGRPLTEYDTIKDAEDGGSYIRQKFGHAMVPYLCPQCSLWHLAPPSTERSSEPFQKFTRESRTCYGKVSGKVLKEYESAREAVEAAKYVSEKYGNQMLSYKCKDCRKWHLSPADRQTEHSSWSCLCLDQNGSPKDCYQSQKDAELRAEILFEETRRRLNVYRCPKIRTIWHLTKKDPKDYVGRKSLQCCNKQGNFRMEYDCGEDAMLHAIEITKRYGKEVFPFECSECLKWHVG